MRVLIVDGHPKECGVGKAVFAEFEEAVRAAFDTAGEVEFRVVHVESLDPYLYVPPTRAGMGELPKSLTNSLADPAGLLAFDRLDFIFLDGPHNTPPWAPPAHKAFVLLHMAFETGKVVFGSAYAAHLLVYLAATGGVFRRVGWSDSIGGRLDQLNMMASTRTRFLNSETGDVYVRAPTRGGGGEGGGGSSGGWSMGDSSALSSSMGGGSSSVGGGSSVGGSSGERSRVVWDPYFNVGLRAHASSNRSSLQYTPRIPSSKGRFAVSVDPAVKNEVSRINVQFRTHWLFADTPSNEMMVPYKHSWDICLSPLAPVRVDVLAATDWTPTILEYGQIVCCKFDITKQSEAALTLIHTFVAHKHSLMRSHAHLEYISQSRFQKTRQEGSSLAGTKRTTKSRKKSGGLILPKLGGKRGKGGEDEGALAGGGNALELFLHSCNSPFERDPDMWMASPSTTLPYVARPSALVTARRTSLGVAAEYGGLSSGTVKVAAAVAAAAAAAASAVSASSAASASSPRKRRYRWKPIDPYGVEVKGPVRVVRVQPPTSNRPYSSWHKFRRRASRLNDGGEALSYRFPEASFPATQSTKVRRRR